MPEGELSVKLREMARDLLQDLGIVEGLKGVYSDQPAQGEEILKAYRKYYRHAFQIFYKPID